MAKAKRYMVNDGKLLLTLEPAGKGWFVVTSPMDPGLITQARSIEEAFEMARDAMKGLRKARRERFRKELQQRRRAG